ncbi:MAG: histidine phosphatase family protein [Acidimicrobiales bacterium]
MPSPGSTLLLVRHGETEWSRDGRHTGRTDLELTALGERQAEELRRLLERWPADVVLSSPLRRARDTAELAGLVPYELDDDLREWDYGDLEGLTSSQIHQTLPGWSIWDGPWPGGEPAEQVGVRADRAIRRALAVDPGQRVALVAHGHLLRALAARWLGEPVRAGRLLGLDTSAVCELGWEHANPVIRRWNLPA